MGKIGYLPEEASSTQANGLRVEQWLQYVWHTVKEKITREMPGRVQRCI